MTDNIGWLEDVFGDDLNSQLLKHAAGRRITCPMCGDVLDWRQTVILDAVVVCARCWRKQSGRLARKHGTAVWSRAVRDSLVDGSLVVGPAVARRLARRWGRS